MRRRLALQNNSAIKTLQVKGCQLNWTQRPVYDVINKNTTDLPRADWLFAVQLGQLSWVELCRYKRAFSRIVFIMHHIEDK